MSPNKKAWLVLESFLLVAILLWVVHSVYVAHDVRGGVWAGLGVFVYWVCMFVVGRWRGGGFFVMIGLTLKSVFVLFGSAFLLYVFHGSVGRYARWVEGVWVFSFFVWLVLLARYAYMGGGYHFSVKDGLKIVKLVGRWGSLRLIVDEAKGTAIIRGAFVESLMPEMVSLGSLECAIRDIKKLYSRSGSVSGTAYTVSGPVPVTGTATTGYYWGSSGWSEVKFGGNLMATGKRARGARIVVLSDAAGHLRKFMEEEGLGRRCSWF